MAKTIEYYVSLISPWTFLGHERLTIMAAQHDATISIYPVDYSVIFPNTGGIPLPKRSEQRKAYRLQELRRWRQHLNIDLTLEPKHFPVSDKLAATMVVSLRQTDPEAAVRLAGACLRACWMQERDISDSATLLEIADEQGLDGTALLSDQEGAAQTIADDSKQAIAKGIFGAPSYRFEGELFWGQDRLDFLERALAR